MPTRRRGGRHGGLEEAPPDSAGTASAGPVYRLVVTLLDVSPPVRRTLLVPASATLADVHRVIRVAMGWRGEDVHHFRAADGEYTDPRLGLEAEIDENAGDESLVTLAEATRDGQETLLYEYHDDDGWEHRLQVEDVLPGGDLAVRAPACLDGTGACPPEGIGGPEAWERTLLHLRGPREDLRREAIRWVGEGFDPEAFDAGEVNRALSEE